MPLHKSLLLILLISIFVFMLQLQLGKRPTTVSQPTVRAGFLPPQTSLGFSWSVGHSEGHCNICMFLKKNLFLCKASAPKFPLKFFPVFLLSKVFSLVKAQCLVFSPNTFRFGLKRGGMLGTQVWSILPSPISSTFTNVHFYPHLTLCILFLLFSFTYLNL